MLEKISLIILSYLLVPVTIKLWDGLLLGWSNSEMLGYVQQADAAGARGEHDDDDAGHDDDDAGEIQHLGDTAHSPRAPVSGGRWWTGCLGDCLDAVFCSSSLDPIVTGRDD